MSNKVHRCPTCGADLPVNAPQGLCPKCLLQGVAAPTQPDFEKNAPRPEPPPLDAIAAAFPQLEILELIGQGGMGCVFKARQPQLNRVIALKLLPDALARDAAFADRFAREARALAALSHPNIVTIHDFGQAGGFFFLLMEFVDGVNLRQALGAGRFTPEQALAIVPPLCDALQFAHDRGIVHCDIKPENLLLDKSGRVKIADFGVAKMLTEGALSDGNSQAQAAPSLSAAGTPGYMAPEQKSAPRQVDRRADIYSMGVVFYEMLTGELPGARFQPPSSRMRGVQIDVRLDEVVLRALAQEPERRYQTAAELGTQVETIALNYNKPADDAREDVKASAPPSISHPTATASQAKPLPFARAALVGLVVGLLTLIVLTIITALVPEQFAGSARIHIVPLNAAGPNWSMATELFMLTSESVLTEVVQRHGGTAGLTTADSVELLKRQLVVQAARNTALVEIRVFSPDPEEAASLANAIAESYRAFRRNDVRVVIIDRAEPARRPSRPNKLRMFMIGAVLGLILGLVASTLTLLLASRRRSQPLKLSVHPAWKLPAALSVVGFYAGLLIGIPLVSLLPVSGDFGYVTVVGLCAVASPVIGVVAGGALRRMLRSDHVEQVMRARRWLKALAGMAFIVALPATGFALFFFQALLSETGGWNPALAEAVFVPVTWGGALLLPAVGVALLRSSKRKQAAQASEENRHRSGWRSRRFIAALLIALLVAAVISVYWRVSHSRTPAQSLMPANGNDVTKPEQASDPAADLWSPDVPSGENPDPRKVLLDAKGLSAQGRFEEALQRHLWYHHHALEFDSSQSAVRLSFALSDWIKLGQAYPKAKQALVAIRDKQTRALMEARGEATQFHEVARINDYLQNADATMALFNSVADANPELARKCYFFAEDLLAEHGEYELCLRFMPNFQQRFELIRHSWKLDQDMAREQPGLGPPAPSEKRFIDKTRQLIEILVATGHLSEAEAIQKQAVTLNADDRLKSAIADAKGKLGR